MSIQFSLPNEQLQMAVSRIQGAMSDRALSQIGIKVLNNTATFTATDRILAVYSCVPCEASNEGFVFVGGKIFSDMVRQLPKGLVQIIQNEGVLIVSAASGFEIKIPVIESSTWIEPPEIASDNSASLPSLKLSYMIEQVQFCVDPESPRNYGVVGFLHKPEPQKLRLVGTDGYRLSYCDVKVETPEAFLQKGVCLSKRGLLEILKMCGEGFETITAAISEETNTLLLSTSGYRIYIRLSAVRYPNYRGVLPASSLHPVNVSRQSLQDMTRRVLLAADKNNTLRLSIASECLTMSSKTAGKSESKESLTLGSLKGANADLSVNGKYLTDVFSCIPSEELTLQYKSATDPIVIVAREEPSDCRSVHVLVPICEQT